MKQFTKLSLLTFEVICKQLRTTKNVNFYFCLNNKIQKMKNNIFSLALDSKYYPEERTDKIILTGIFMFENFIDDLETVEVLDGNNMIISLDKRDFIDRFPNNKGAFLKIPINVQRINLDKMQLKIAPTPKPNENVRICYDAYNEEGNEIMPWQ